MSAMGEDAEMRCNLHSLIADIAFFAGDRVLLVKYKDVEKYDGETGWFLPDDGIRRLEPPDQAARRIVKEQIGLADARPRLDHVESFVGNDGTWHLPFHYVVELDRVPRLRPSEDLGVAEWFDLTKLPPRSDVAHHGWALATIRRIRGKA